MSRTDRSDAIRDAFLDALKTHGAAVESMGDLAAAESNETIRNLFLALGRAGREVYLVRGVGFINVHIRSEPPGWWNILKTVKRDLDFLARELGVRSYYVLLIGRKDRYTADGYIATDFSSLLFSSLLFSSLHAAARNRRNQVYGARKATSRSTEETAVG